MRMNCTTEAWEKTNYANDLQSAGYTTAYFGKYLNPPAMVRYCRNETLGPMEAGWPSGWDIFYGMCDQMSTPEGGYYDMNWIDSTKHEVDFTGKVRSYMAKLSAHSALQFRNRAITPRPSSVIRRFHSSKPNRSS
jgi:arylsulfatase A-like enzyme